MSLVGMLFTLFSVKAAVAAELKGSFSLAPDEILVSSDKPYSGQFDLREQWGEDPQVTLTRLVVTFHFRDDDQWQMEERRGRPEKEGRPLRTIVRNLIGTEEPALEQRYKREVFNSYSNPVEVARLQIGADRYFAATSRRRLEKRHDHGESRSFHGLKSDPETGQKVASYSLTRRVLVEQWDGYSDEFTIRAKPLSLDALIDLAEDGILPFTLDGEGDYLLVGATLDYEGYTHPGFKIAGEEEEDEIPGHILPLGLLGLASGGGLVFARRKREKKHVKVRQQEARRRYGERRQAELEQMEQEDLEAEPQTA